MERKERDLTIGLVIYVCVWCVCVCVCGGGGGRCTDTDNDIAVVREIMFSYDRRAL